MSLYSKQYLQYVAVQQTVLAICRCTVNSTCNMSLYSKQYLQYVAVQQTVLTILRSPHLAVARCLGIFFWESICANLSANLSTISKFEMYKVNFKASLCVLCLVHIRMCTFCVHMRKGN
jgi:hypothetical protein